jgi:hypothetical protein
VHLTTAPRRMLLTLAALGVAGCSGDPNRPYPVRGVVVFEDDRPAKELAGGSVTFVPISEPERAVSSGTINEDGTFTLSCRREGDGAVAGTHRVEVAPPGKEDEDDNPKARRPRVALDPSTAVQEVTVEPRSNEITLKVKRAGPKAR